MSKPMAVAAKFIIGYPTQQDFTTFTHEKLISYRNDVQKAIDIIMENGNTEYLNMWSLLLNAINLQISVYLNIQSAPVNTTD